MTRPGAYLAAFGAPRTVHRLTSGLEDAGLEVRDTLLWLYGSGMPKSRRLPGGRGTALKPAYEPIILARKPLVGTVERNLAVSGTGALNIDAARVEDRYPANITLAHAPGCTSERCEPDCPTVLIDRAAERQRGASTVLPQASRLFYCPKAGRRERNAGCETLPVRELDLFPHIKRAGRRPPPAANHHPTVKPLALMRWLVGLVAPAGGVVLDPFCGSGTTGCAAVLEDRLFIGIEREPEYVTVARARIAHWAMQAHMEDPDDGSLEEGGGSDG